MAADEVCAFAQRLLPVLLECEVPFKIAQSVDDIERINSGDAGAAQLGKILTVYPPDEQAARTLILQLDRAWPTTHGPEVQTDLHLRARLAVSFRYGVFGAAPPVLDRMQG